MLSNRIVTCGLFLSTRCQSASFDLGRKRYLARLSDLDMLEVVSWMAFQIFSPASAGKWKTFASRKKTLSDNIVMVVYLGYLLNSST